jgi:hypothetical protein
MGKCLGLIHTCVLNNLKFSYIEKKNTRKTQKLNKEKAEEEKKRE